MPDPPVPAGVGIPESRPHGGQLGPLVGSLVEEVPLRLILATTFSLDATFLRELWGGGYSKCALVRISGGVGSPVAG